jgi:proline racemase
MRFSRVLNVVDSHAAGEVGRVVVGGVGDVPGATVFEKRIYLQENLDQLRKLLLFEPRGSVVQNANIIVPAAHPDAQMGYVILESTEYPAMSGSNTICVATVLLETGMLPMAEPVTELALESPAGLIRVRCECRDGKVLNVRFVNQPAFAYYLDARIDVDGLGTLTADVAYGGMTFVIVDAGRLGFALVPSEARALTEIGQRIKQAGAEQLRVSHPDDPRIPGITMTLFAGPLGEREGQLTARNAVVVSPGRVDRSPCGTGTSARLAVLHAKGLIRQGENFIHESITGTTFDSCVESTTRVGRYAAVVPAVAGQAWITGFTQLGLDPTDPFPQGYSLSDTWMTALE